MLSGRVDALIIDVHNRHVEVLWDNFSWLLKENRVQIMRGTWPPLVWLADYLCIT